MTQKTLTHYLLEARSRSSERAAIRFKKKGEWISLSWSKYFQEIEEAAGGLASLGVERGDRVALMANTRVEWCEIDLATLGLGAITVPIYQNSLAEEMEHIINNCEPKVLVLETDRHLKMWEDIKSRCPSVKAVIVIQPTRKECSSFKDLKKAGREFLKNHKQIFIDNCLANTPDQTATLIYTSGTTGLPKGVVLTHRQVISELEDIFTVVGIDEDDETLAFLPYAHVFGRVEGWGNIYCGYTLSFAEGIDKIKANMLEVRPTFFIGVPRIFEKIYNGIQSQLDAQPWRKKVFDWALGIGRQVSHHRTERTPLPFTLIASYIAAKRLVFDSIRQGLGGRLRFAISGGAPLALEIAQFFHAADILILEGYGLTETTAGITANAPFDFEFGTVGKPLKDVSIKIAEDGEILVKSDKVMKEYYKDPEATAKVFEDGYFKTGDIGEWTESGHLRITDRKKDLIKTANGKYVAPQKIENLLKSNHFISEVLVHGDQRKYIVALLTLNRPTVEQYASTHGITYRDWPDLLQHPKIREHVRATVTQVNSKLASHETVKNFALLETNFSVDTGELTPSLKVKRKFCDEKYRKELDQLYEI